MNAGQIMAEAFVDELSKMAEDNEELARKTDYLFNKPNLRQKKGIREMATADLSALSPSAKKFVAKSKASGRTPLEYSRGRQRVELRKRVLDRIDKASKVKGRGPKRLMAINSLWDKVDKHPDLPMANRNPDSSGKALEKARIKEEGTRGYVKKVSDAAKADAAERAKAKAKMLREQAAKIRQAERMKMLREEATKLRQERARRQMKK